MDSVSARRNLSTKVLELCFPIIRDRGFINMFGSSIDKISSGTASGSLLKMRLANEFVQNCKKLTTSEKVELDNRLLEADFDNFKLSK